MANKTPYSIADQIALLKQRGMLFNPTPYSGLRMRTMTWFSWWVWFWMSLMVVTAT